MSPYRLRRPSFGKQTRCLRELRVADFQIDLAFHRKTKITSETSEPHHAQLIYNYKSSFTEFAVGHCCVVGKDTSGPRLLRIAVGAYPKTLARLRDRTTPPLSPTLALVIAARVARYIAPAKIHP